jgi:prepilin-type N-terminal cleavage/methylation domain-containing protein
MTNRRGFTLPEMLLALAALAVAAVLAAQLGTGALAERARTDARLDAADAAGNVLEAARALPWDGLTPAWAAGQKLPEFVADRLADGALTATVEPEPDRPRVKRVTVTVRWTHDSSRPARPVRLVGLFAARTAEGGRP